MSIHVLLIIALVINYVLYCLMVALDCIEKKSHFWIYMIPYVSLSIFSVIIVRKLYKSIIKKYKELE